MDNAAKEIVVEKVLGVTHKEATGIVKIAENLNNGNLERDFDWLVGKAGEYEPERP